MAVVYYPIGQKLYSKDTAQGNYQALVLASSPDVVLYFGTASVPTSASALDLPITCSWARSASISNTYNTYTSGGWATESLSASYTLSSSFSDTASFALNASMGSANSASWASSSLSSSYMNFAPYTTLTTSSLNWITCSFLDNKEWLFLGTSSVTYNFTCSNLPSAGQYGNVSLFISNSFTGNTASVTFPSNWVFIGLAPTFITASRCAYLNLEAFGSQVVAMWATQY